MTTEADQKLRQMAEFFMANIPHNHALGISLAEVGRGFMELSLPWDEKLVGNPETEVVHGGVITTLIDGCCGGAVLTALPVPRRVATLDLRIDYLRPATPRQLIRARAECYRVTTHVAFVRAFAWDDDVTNAVATAAGTFALFDTPAPGTEALLEKA